MLSNILAGITGLAGFSSCSLVVLCGWSWISTKQRLKTYKSKTPTTTKARPYNFKTKTLIPTLQNQDLQIRTPPQNMF
jgi:hypothetical protein